MDGLMERRTILKAAAAALVVPVAPALAQPAPPRVITEAAANSPNGGPGQVTAFLRIGTDGKVTFASPVTEMGQGTHTSHAMIVADELDCALSAVEVIAGQPEPALRLQPVNEMYSGASFGIRFWHDRIRRACAQARMVLVEAAAQRLGVPADQLATAEGRVTHAASGRALSYGELAEAAARLPLPEQPRIKPAAERRITGRNAPRFDIPAKTNGSAVYGHDIRLPGMAFAVARLSPVFGAELDGFDRASVAGIRGIVDVVPLKNGVAVVAENTWAAMEGAKRIAVRFKPTPEQNLDSAELSRRLRAGLEAPDAFRGKNDGDIEATLRGAARVVEATYEAPYLAHAPMETENATVRIQGDRVEVWSSTQHQDWCVRDAARAAGVPPANVRIHTPMTGGGFGRRLHTEVVEQATLVAKAVNRPVRLIWTREDEFAQSYWRPAFAAKMQAALDAQGRVIGFNIRAAGQSVMGDYRPALFAGPLRGNDPFSLQSVSDTRYRFGAFRAEWKRVEAAPKVWLWRSVGSSQFGFFIESFLDEVAQAAGKDPLALRRELLAHDARALRVLNTAAEQGGWGTPLAAGRHRGIAYMECYGSLCAQVAEISVANNQVRVHRVTVAIDSGDVVNPDTVAAQMQGGVVWGLSAMAGEKVTLKGGAAEQRNFDAYPILRIGSAPAQVDVHIIRSGEALGGIGEPGVPPLAPAVCNAIFAATGRRLRSLPLSDHGLSV
ncbi:xanthine dehydrogenase family protein molybdopterin-binding subunit [Falsiroseomonas oryzae]|uniref:xanthine dehydrogenase family protein molybdopterin-binding subunit n=1 Tax=Falsiroseomonas oryzae TaxID=2766473 RepID=UPI0022EA202C|nr:molybdopterin cofactor-binding domain-containing protein [Roseomonas sp. MO-31]